MRERKIFINTIMAIPKVIYLAYNFHILERVFLHFQACPLRKEYRNFSCFIRFFRDGKSFIKTVKISTSYGRIFDTNKNSIKNRKMYNIMYKIFWVLIAISYKKISPKKRQKLR